MEANHKNKTFLEKSFNKIKKFFGRVRSDSWIFKKTVRDFIALNLYYLFCKNENEETENKMHFAFIIIRIVCKALVGIGCLCVSCSSIAILFCKPLQTFLNLNNFITLLSNFNTTAIVELLSVTIPSLFFASWYLLKSIGSIHVCCTKTDEQECDTDDKYKRIVDRFESNYMESTFSTWAIENTNSRFCEYCPHKKFDDLHDALY
jgi:hypothetical protein